MANQLNLGRDFDIKPKGPCLYIHDEIPLIPFAKIFDARIHPLNPLQDLDYKKLRQIVATFDTLFPGGEDTLTKMTGLSFLAAALAAHPTSFDTLIPEPDKKSTTGHVWAYERVRDLMRSPVLKAMLTSPRVFGFPPDAVILCRVNRRELTDFDATAITLFLMATYPGQLIIPDFGFYGRPAHTALIRENRLIAGVRSLRRIERRYPDLHDELLAIDDKVVAGALYPDAVLLAEHKGFQPDTIEFNEEVRKMMLLEPTAPPKLWVPPPLAARPAKKAQRWKSSDRDPYA